MNIVPGHFYLCIDPSAPMHGSRVEVTRIEKAAHCLPDRVCFICDSPGTLHGWVFSQASEDFIKNFSEWPPAPAAPHYSRYQFLERT